jgi:hypothetical protein
MVEVGLFKDADADFDLDTKQKISSENYFSLKVWFFGIRSEG